MGQLFTQPYTNQTTSWLMHGWSTFGARMNHGHTRIHKIHTIHHGLDLRKAITFPFIVFSMLGHGACTHMSFCPRTPKLGVLKFPKLGLPQLWKPITFCVNLRLKWGLKQSYNPRWELFNNMWYTICTQVNQGDSWLLVVRSQIDILTPNLSFGHKLCFKYSNRTCKTILNI